ncbi:hypothetical protein DPSP01_007304 [Paraphaeosphaeria sporulosa]
MAKFIPSNFVNWLFDLPECTPPDDWRCSICYEAPPEADCVVEIVKTPMQLACGHVFDLGCLYAWTNGHQLRKGMKSHANCPLCREFIDVAEDRAKCIIDEGKEWLEIDQDWKMAIDQLVQDVTDTEGGFVGRQAVCDGQTVRFLSFAHEQHGHLWLELFLAVRILREAFDNDWTRTDEMVDFEKWFVQEAEQYESRLAKLGLTLEDINEEGLDVAFVALRLD